MGSFRRTVHLWRMARRTGSPRSLGVRLSTLATPAPTVVPRPLPPRNRHGDINDEAPYGHGQTLWRRI
jgi:hypothetical protein